MRKEIVESLSALGFSHADALIYTSIAELGECSVAEIIKHSGLHRPNVYDSLKRLIHKGLISNITRGKAKVFDLGSSISVVHIVQEQQLLAVRVAQELSVARQLAARKGEAFVYEGVLAFQRILESMLSYNQPIFVYGIPPIAPVLMKNFIEGYHLRRIEKKIVMKHIYNFNALERIKYLNTMQYTQAKFLPQQYESFVSTTVCGDEVVLTIWSETPTIIQIKSNTTAESYRKHFDLLWKNAKRTI